MPKGKPIEMQRGNRPFTPLEAYELVNLMVCGKHSPQEVSDLLGRSLDSIQTKTWKVLTKYKGEVDGMPVSTERAGARWSQYEHERGQLALDEHGDFAWLAICLRRPEPEVRAHFTPKPVSRGAGFGF